jgi:hypothetical protein
MLRAAGGMGVKSRTARGAYPACVGTRTLPNLGFSKAETD